MKRSCSGFTLIEVTIAVLIAALVLGGVYGVFSTVATARDRLEEEGNSYHQARIFFDRIGSELSSLRFTPVGGMAPLVAGSTEYGRTFLEFNTELSSPLQRMQGGLSRVRYELREETGSQKISLYRSDQRLLIDATAAEALPFVTGLAAFEIRYFSAGVWHSNWSAPTPPQMMEIFLEVDRGSGEPIPFRTSFVLIGGRG